MFDLLKRFEPNLATWGKVCLPKTSLQTGVCGGGKEGLVGQQSRKTVAHETD